MMPRLLILTPYFPPELGAPQARLSELGERLLELGWEVEVLTALPNYPTGRIFDGYPRRRPVVEQVGRLRAVRVPLYPSNRGFVRRILSYLSFVLAACWYGPGRCARPDVLLVESPPLFTGFAARYLSRRWRCPYVFNVSDLWPESAVRMGALGPGLALSLAERLERYAYRGAALVTGQSRQIVAGVHARAPEVPVLEISGGVEPERFGPHRADPEIARLLGDEPGPIFLYAGLLGLAQGLDQILDAARELPAEVPGRAVLVGDGVMREHLERRIAEERVPRVRLLPSQPREHIPALLEAADAALITLGLDLPGAVPSKIYEAMAAGRPILLVGGGEAAERVEESAAGLVVSPGDLPALRDAWHRLALDPALRHRLGRQGRERAETVYSRRAIAETLARALEPLISGQR